MILHIKKGYHVHVEFTREELKKRGFRFSAFKNDPQRFEVYLTEQGRKMYATPRKRKGDLFKSTIKNN